MRAHVRSGRLSRLRQLPCPALTLRYVSLAHTRFYINTSLPYAQPPAGLFAAMLSERFVGRATRVGH